MTPRSLFDLTEQQRSIQFSHFSVYGRVRGYCHFAPHFGADREPYEYTNIWLKEIFSVHVRYCPHQRDRALALTVSFERMQHGMSAATSHCECGINIA